MINLDKTQCWDSLIRAVILQALLDLKSKDKAINGNAETFLKSDFCRWMCDEVNEDYSKIKKIDYSNPSNSLNFNIK